MVSTSQSPRLSSDLLEVRIWVDLANSPHVLFFAPLIAEMEQRGHSVFVTARLLAQTTELARLYDLEARVIGAHGGRGTQAKVTANLERALALRRAARIESVDLAVSHNSYSQAVGARLLGIPSVTIMDYEHTPANHISFRLASRVILPDAIEQRTVRKFGVTRRKYVGYPGFKEQVYLEDFRADPLVLERLDPGLTARTSLVVAVARPPADFAVYHRFANPLFLEWLRRTASDPSVRIIVLPRNNAQHHEITQLRLRSVLLPDNAVQGPSLVHAADLVVSAGGTMNREAAVLGVPAYSLFQGRPAAVDRALEGLGRLTVVADEDSLGLIRLEKKQTAVQLRNPGLKEMILDSVLQSP
jgi:uncharacterized protein